jgi:hypothetical protein
MEAVRPQDGHAVLDLGGALLVLLGAACAAGASVRGQNVAGAIFRVEVAETFGT